MRREQDPSFFTQRWWLSLLVLALAVGLAYCHEQAAAQPASEAVEPAAEEEVAKEDKVDEEQEKADGEGKSEQGKAKEAKEGKAKESEAAGEEKSASEKSESKKEDKELDAKKSDEKENAKEKQDESSQPVKKDSKEKATEVEQERPQEVEPTEDKPKEEKKKSSETTKKNGKVKKKKCIIGATATLLEKQSELKFRARVDSGAKSCSLHVEEIRIENESKKTDIVERMTENIGKVIRFEVRNGDNKTHILTSKIHSYVIIKNSTKKEGKRRYKVPLTFLWKDMEKEVLVTLSDRKHMEYPLLLGRNFLRGDFLVDVEKDSDD